MTNSDNNNFNNLTNEEYVESNKATLKSTLHNIIHRNSTIIAVLLFVAICTINILSVFTFELGYWYFVEPIGGYLPSIINLFFFLVMAIVITAYTIMCCRYNLRKQLTAITAAFGLIALSSLITSGIFFPIFNAGTLVFGYITNNPEYDGGLICLLAYILNIATLIGFACLSGYALTEKYRNKPKTHRLSLGQITAILSVAAAVFLIIYGFAFAKYEYDAFDEAYYKESPQEFYLSEITAEERKLYSNIQIGDDAGLTEKELAEKELVEKGFVKQNKSYEDYMWDCLFPYYVDDYLPKNNPENTNGSNCAIYCYTNEMDEVESWDDVISCIIISYDQNGKINYKLFIPDTNSISMDGYYMNYRHGEDTEKWFDNMQKGDNAESTLKFIRSTGAVIIEDEKCVGETKINTYKIILQCYYPLKAEPLDFLLNRYPEDINYFYDFKIIATDDVISKKQDLYNW